MSITGTDVMWTELNDTPFFDFSATSIENITQGRPFCTTQRPFKNASMTTELRRMQAVQITKTWSYISVYVIRHRQMPDPSYR